MLIDVVFPLLVSLLSSDATIVYTDGAGDEQNTTSEASTSSSYSPYASTSSAAAFVPSLAGVAFVLAVLMVL